MTSRLSARFVPVEPPVPVPTPALPCGHRGGPGWGSARWRRFASCAGGAQTAGFTLIELLVVLAIIGMSVAIAVPLLARHLTGASLNAATSQIRTALRGARSTAITEDRPVVFRGDPGGGYWLDRHHFTLPAMGGEPPRVAIEGGAQISFYPSGGSSGGRIVVVSGDAQHRLAVDTLTGRAR